MDLSRVFRTEIISIFATFSPVLIYFKIHRQYTSLRQSRSVNHRGAQNVCVVMSPFCCCGERTHTNKHTQWP